MQHSLQGDLDKIDAYGQEWLIKFNGEKTVMQTFSTRRETTLPKLHFGEQQIPESDDHKHLGLTFSKDLRFHSHVNDTMLKVNRALSPLYSLAKYLPSTVRRKGSEGSRLMKHTTRKLTHW